jgi:hypothetical protein
LRLVVAHHISCGGALDIDWLPISVARIRFVEEFFDGPNTLVPFWHGLECVVAFPIYDLWRFVLACRRNAVILQ